MFFFPENKDHLSAVLALESSKDELSRNYSFLAKEELALAKIQTTIGWTKGNLFFLKTEAQIVSAREFKKLKYELASMLESEIVLLGKISFYKRQITIIQQTIEEQQIAVEKTQFKLLEFKK